MAAMAQEGGGENGAAAKAVSITAFKPQLLVPARTMDEALRFYREAFAAEELKRTYNPKRKAEQEFPLVVSAELKIGSSSLLVCDQKEDYPVAVDGAKGGGIEFRVETEDVEGVVAKAVKAGAVLQGEITEEDGLYGSGLLGKVKDPFGVVWAFASPGRKCAEAVA